MFLIPLPRVAGEGRGGGVSAAAPVPFVVVRLPAGFALAFAPLAPPFASGFSSLPFSASSATTSSSVASSITRLRGRLATVLPCWA